MSRDGTGSLTVYEEPDKPGQLMATMPAEYNDLTFKEPYLLAMAANEKGETGSQFFVTTDVLQPLNGSPHTIIGRMVRGKATLDLIEGTQPYRVAMDESKGM